MGSMSEMKALLCKYAKVIARIDRLETYVISAEYYSELPTIINATKQNPSFLKHLNYCIEVATSVKNIELFVGIAYNPNISLENLRWRPVLCYQYNKNFYHVLYKENWVCMDCNYDKHTVIMQLVSGEPDTYYGTEKPEYSPIFQKIPCKNCGRLLQGYLIDIQKGALTYESRTCSQRHCH